MLYEKIEYIINELETLSLETELIENLKIIAYYFDSSRPDDAKKYFKNIIERIWQLSNSIDNNYSLYIVHLVLIYLKELKDSYPQIMVNRDFFKTFTIFFSYVEVILKKVKEKSKEVTKERKKEIIDILKKNFSEEYYYRKKSRLTPKQDDLPF